MTVRPWLGLAAPLALVSLVGCGSIEYGDTTREVVEVHTPGQSYVVQDPPSVEYRAQVVQAPPTPPAQVYAPPPPAQPPPAQPQPYAQYTPPPQPQAAPGTFHCSGNERVRIHHERVDAPYGPAIVATGNCVVEVTDSIVRGSPAIVVSGNAQVLLSESRVIGGQGRRARRHWRRWRRHHHRHGHGPPPPPGGPDQTAVRADGNGAVQLVSCQIRGDLVSSGNGRIGTQHVAHRGSILRAAF